MATALNYGAARSFGSSKPAQRSDGGPTVTKRYRPLSMQLVAYLDGHYVELHVLTDNGETISISCPGDSIFALQQHIEQFSRQCPEIAGWNQMAQGKPENIDDTSNGLVNESRCTDERSVALAAI